MNSWSPLFQFDAITLFFWPFFSYDFSVTNITFSLFLVIFLLLFLIYNFNAFFKIIPGSWQYFLEVLFLFVFDILDKQIGSKGYIYFPFIYTLFVFILLCNLISLTPFGFALTSHIVLIFFLSFTLGLGTFFLGIFNRGFDFFKLFIPECPLMLMPFLILLRFFLTLLNLLV